MKATCRTFLVDNTRLWIKIELASINTVAITVSIPCRNGQYVILECDNASFYQDYYNGKCMVHWLQDTRKFYRVREMLDYISTWFKYRYAIRLEDPEDPYTIKELYKVL